MEKHKLIHLILKDLEELNEIAGELKQSQELSRFMLDIAVSKSKLVAQEFEFLKELSQQKSTNGSALKEPTTLASPIVSEPAMETTEEEITAKVESPKQAIEQPEPSSIQPEKSEEPTTTEPEPQVAEVPEEPISAETNEVEPEAVVSPNIQEVEEVSEKQTVMAENLPEEKEEPVFSKTLGENFVTGKSLNDLLLEGKPVDTKLSSSPIQKLETAIGLNDRFQYTRELFNNNPELFSQTVKEIDQAQNLEEAVAYLNSNFKWKKTDTSVQFAQLVKRRFNN
ncbi:hypothetical protein [Sunxiuqinia rutila]|uniref:hypothetical protein n=1 Tax=Sunxiuqinia rutila TaxID=1397841 RepID=UPI003D367867